MSTRHTRRGPAGVGTILLLTLALLAAACGEEAAEVTTTQAATTTTEASTTTTSAPGMAISYRDALSGLLQGLLTSDEATAALGLTLVDRGRQVIPPGSEQRTGFLCPAGQAILDPLGSAYDPQVSVSFAPEGAEGRSAWVTESLLFEEADQNAGDFATLVSAIDACAGIASWETPEAGEVRIEALDLPAMGDESYAYRILVNEGGGAGGPSMEMKSMTIRLGPVLLEVSATMILNAPAPAAFGDGGVLAMAAAAFAKIEEGLADAGEVTVEAADPEEIGYLAGLIQGLLTAEEIGGGWKDQGRVVVPVGAQDEAFGAALLCPEGVALANPIGLALNELVFTHYRREGSPDLRESLLWGHEAALTEAFATGKAAVEACFDREPWDTPDMGALRMHRLDVPGLGTQSVAYYVGPGAQPGADPWLEMQVLSVLVAGLDPANDNAVVVNLVVITIHDPAGAAVEMLDHQELIRIAEAAISKFTFDG